MLDVYYGNNTALGRQFGVSHPNLTGDVYYSIYNEMFITFTADESISAAGFNISYRIGMYIPWHWRIAVFQPILRVCDGTTKPSIWYNFVVKKSESPVIGYGPLSPCTNPPMFINETMSIDGELTTPHFPYWYENNLDCQWHIRTSEKHAIKLTIRRMYTEEGGWVSITKLLSKDPVYQIFLSIIWLLILVF